MNGRPQPHPHPIPPPIGSRTTTYDRPPFKPTPYTHAESERIQTLLDQLLGPEYVSSRPGGGAQVQYLEGWRSLNLANEVFGFNGWNSELVSCTVDFLDCLPAGKFSIGVSVVVRVTLKDGTYREDFGYGSSENCRSKAAAFEKVKKEAYTDGLKRCFRCFGNLIGNCLYDKDISKKIKSMKVERREYGNELFFRETDEKKREKERIETMKVSLMEGQGGPHRTQDLINAPQPIPQQAPNLQKQNTPQPRRSPKKTYVPSAEDMEILDESFFSDMDDEFSQDIKGPTPEEIPSTQMRFVSARGADAIQKNPDDDTVPEFDPKFIAPGMKRTLDPTVSAPTKNPNNGIVSGHTNIGGVGSRSISTGGNGINTGGNGINTGGMGSISAGSGTSGSNTRVNNGNSRGTPLGSGTVSNSPSVGNNGIGTDSPMGKRIGMPPSQRPVKRLHKETTS